MRFAKPEQEMNQLKRKSRGKENQLQRQSRGKENQFLAINLMRMHRRIRLGFEVAGGERQVIAHGEGNRMTVWENETARDPLMNL